MASSSSALLSSLLVLFSILLFGFTEARDILVGGNANAWKIPSNESASLSLWAAATRFRIGDSLGDPLHLKS
uniref:Uncharacterized protein n=1 Tax=Nelumbo nucifera TaxID=4432 RepID=A0A822Y814_NELNU|nr:TPA_asm: hypothetical protein HUJ06_028917 [Nelumbo nucifera]